MFKPEILARNIKICRTKLGLTQLELAEKLFVSSQAIAKWESGQSIPDLATYDCGNNIVLAGGLFNDGTILVDLINRHLKSKANFIIPTLPQIYGACYKALRLYGRPSNKFYESFKANYQAMK